MRIDAHSPSQKRANAAPWCSWNSTTILCCAIREKNGSLGSARGHGGVHVGPSAPRASAPPLPARRP